MTTSLARVPPCFRVDDEIKVDGDDTPWRISGFAVRGNRGRGTGRPVNDRTEYALLTNGFNEKFCPLTDLVRLGSVESRGPDPLRGVDGERVHEAMRGRMAEVLSPREGEPPISLELFQFAREVHGPTGAPDEGHIVLVVGGAVRDALLGASVERKDLDFAGTLLHVGFQYLVRHVEAMAAGGELALVDRICRIDPSKDDAVLKITGTDGRSRSDYAPLKLEWDPYHLGGAPSYVYGSSFRTDAGWRDATINALLYDPLGGQVYDPTGHGLADLGLDRRSLGSPIEDVGRRGFWLRPIDPPPGAPAETLVKRLARLLHQLLRFADEYPHTEPVSDWCHDHEPRLLQALLKHSTEPGGSSGQHPFTAAVREFLTDDEIGLIEADDARFEHLLGPEIWQTVRSLLPKQAPINVGGTSRGQPPGRVPSEACRALARLAHAGGNWEVIDVEGPDEPTLVAVLRYFGDRLVGYRHAHVTVRLDDGGEVDSVLALAPPPFSSDPWYAELDSEYALIQSPGALPSR